MPYLDAQHVDGKLRLEQEVLTVAHPQPSCLPLLPTHSILPLPSPPHPLPQLPGQPSPTYVLASFPPYSRWASFSSSMSQYLLQNSVTSLPWSLTAFMGG